MGRDGTLVYIPTVEQSRTVVWVDREGRYDHAFDGSYHWLKLSPDGSRVAADDLADRIWVHDIARGTRILVAEENGLVEPLWSPDGTELAYTSGDGHIYVKAADGTGEARRLLARANVQWPLCWAPDGEFLAITNIGDTEGRDVFILPRGGDPFSIRLFTGQRERGRVFAGRNVDRLRVGRDRKSGDLRTALSGPGTREPVSSDGGRAPVWARDGRELFYRQGTAVMAVKVSTEPAFRAEKPMMLFDIVLNLADELRRHDAGDN